MGGRDEIERAAYDPMVSVPRVARADRPRRSCIACSAALAALALLSAACSDDDGGADASTDDTDSSTTAPPSDTEGTATTAAPGSADAVFPGAEWATAEPEEVGLDPEGIEAIGDYLESTDSHCMAVIKGGRLVAEQYWQEYTPETEQEIFSASKSVSATLVGIAQDQGALDIDQPASDFITEWQGTDSEDITIRNLLSNDSGRYYDFETDYFRMTTAENRTEFAIGLDQQHPVGEHWEYNNSAIQTLNAVLERATGQDQGEFSQEHLFGPLGMQSHYQPDRSGTEPTFMGVQASCRDLARFGYLYLRGGQWDGEQIVSQEFVQEATSPSQELNQAYGFLWWLNEENYLIPVVGGEGEGLFWPDSPDDAYAALGLGDQIALVLPSQDMVVTRLGPWRSDRSEGAEPVPSTSVNELGRLAAAAVVED
jgi:CubicO group peptidase (beta-lactamase class C family)